MAANRKLIARLLLVVMIFLAGCSLVTTSSTNVDAELTTPWATSLILREGTQTLTPTYIPTKVPSATLTYTPTKKPSATLTYTPIVATSMAQSNPTGLGLSTGGYPIDVYRYGSGPISIVLIGGIHGGYEWNTILLAYEIIDYLDLNPDIVQSQLSVYIIPSANPDGQARVVGHAGRFSEQEVVGDTFEGRFNGNGVDINRNWDCDWSPDAFWRDTKLDPGKEPFSEVETRLLRDFILNLKPVAVIFWHSAYPAVFPGGCNADHQPSRSLSELYALSSGYPALDAFTSYKVTGNASNWLALQNIPAIEVELTNHVETDFNQNLKGVLSMFEYIANDPPAIVPSTQQSP